MQAPHLALGPGGLASMPPTKPAAKDTASGMCPTSALIRNHVGKAALATQAPANSGIMNLRLHRPAPQLSSDVAYKPDTAWNLCCMQVFDLLLH